jgi:PRTRC genetic system protein C
MTTATIETVQRVFKYGAMTLSDMFPHQEDAKRALIDGYAEQYPELNMVELSSPVNNGNVNEFTVIKKSAGTKG